MQSLKIAFRNILREKKRTFLLAAAIAFGVMIIILLNGLSEGMVGNVKDNLSHLLSGHIFITANEITSTGLTEMVMRDDKMLNDALKNLKIPYKSITKLSFASGEMIFASKTAKRLAIYGIDLKNDNDFLENLNLIEGKLEDIQKPNHIIITEKTAKKLNVQVGEEVLYKTTTTTGQNNVDTFIIAATIKGNDIVPNQDTYANMATINRLINLKDNEFQYYSVMLQDLNFMEKATDSLYDYMKMKVTDKLKLAERFRFDFSMLESMTDFTEDEEEGEEGDEEKENPLDKLMKQMFGGTADPSRAGEITYNISNINDRYSFIFGIIDTIKAVATVIFLILMVIIMVGITNTFRMVLIERYKEIGTMRAMGMQRPVVLKIFLFEAILIGLLGTLSGILLGTIIGNIFSLISFAEFNFLSIFLHKDRFSYLLPISGMISTMILIPILCVIAAFSPSRKASKIDPAKALSTNF